MELFEKLFSFFGGGGSSSYSEEDAEDDLDEVEMLITDLIPATEPEEETTGMGEEEDEMEMMV